MKLVEDLDFLEVKRERAYDGFLKIDKLFFKQKNVYGEWTDVFSREVIYRRNAVAVLIRDPAIDKLLFTKQLRPGAYIQHESWIYEMVAGLIDAGEDKETALRREVLEEASIDTLNNIQLISSYYPSCGGLTEKVFLYYAEADLSNVPDFAGCPEENEVIQTVLLSVDEAFEWLEQGLLKTANAHAALYWLMKERLLKRI